MVKKKSSNIIINLIKKNTITCVVHIKYQYIIVKYNIKY